MGKLPHLSRGEINRLMAAGEVRLNGRPGAKGARLRADQTVEVPEDAAWQAPVPQSDLPLEVLAHSPSLLALNKPAGMACHPLRPGERGTLANALLARYPECAAASPETREAGLVHRLDRSTSGVILAARLPAVHAKLRQQFSQGLVHKEYLALAHGTLCAEAEVTASVKPAPGDPTRVVAEDEYLPDPAHEAHSRVIPLEQLPEHTLIRVHSSTGRRHQVRIHLAHLGHPLVGDTLYGGPALPGVEGACLHASRVTLPDEGGDFTAPAPWETLLTSLRNEDGTR